MNFEIKNVATTIAVSILLAAYGSGGRPNTPAGSAEGVYGGALTGSTSSAFQMLVLENDEIWTLYGTQTATAFSVTGFLQGQGQSNNGTYSASNLRDFGFNPALSGTATATYNSSSKTISGTATFPGAAAVDFGGGPVSGSLYNYNTAAAVSTVAGSWALTSLSGEGITLNVASGGTYTASSSLGCSFTGTLVPRASGKNVFNVSFSFGPSPCALPNQAASGVAVAYPLANGRTQLIVAGANAARTIGTAAFGTR